MHCAIIDYKTIFVTKFPIFNCFYYRRVLYFTAKKEKKVEAKYKNVEYKPL